MIPDHMSHLPVVGGRPVPWVAIWTGERHTRPDVNWTPKGIECSGPVSFMNGMWWLTGEMHHVGVPLFGQTHSARQRRCMRVPKCQVCGVTGAGPLAWIVPNEATQRHYWDDLGAMINPPTCHPCLDFALNDCPHLASTPPYVVITNPSKVELAYAHGQVVGRDGRPMPNHVAVELDNPDRVFVLGRQLLVRVEP